MEILFVRNLLLRALKVKMIILFLLSYWPLDKQFFSISGLDWLGQVRQTLLLHNDFI
jgi:hypothetical protein